MSASIENYVQAMPQAFRSDRAGGLNTIYHLDLTGAEGGSWTISVANRQARVSTGAPAQPDVTIRMSTSNFRKLAAGRLNVMQAYQQRQVQIEGSQQLALKFAELFPAWEQYVQTGATPPQDEDPQPKPPSPTPAPPTVDDYARAIPNGFKPAKAGSLRATYQFNISGNGTWTATVNQGAVSVSKVQIDSPNVVIDISADNFIKLAKARLNPVQAYQQRQISVSGDLNLAAKFSEIFGAWAGSVTGGTPAPKPEEPSSPKPPTKPPTSSPPPEPGSVYPHLMNGSFDEYQPYVRKGEAKVWKEDRFPEEYGKYWTLETIREKSGRRFHLMSSAVFGPFTQAYFGGGGRDYHIHGRHSQVITSRYEFDLAFYQTVKANPGQRYTFKGSLVSFFQGTSGPPVHDKIFKVIGIDPTGGRAYDADTVVWGDRDGRDNEWRYPSLSVTAQANAITVFIRLINTEDDVGRTELNIVHLDNFKLE